MHELGHRFAGRRLDIDHLLYLPDSARDGPLPARINPTPVVDARSRDRRAARIADLLDERPTPSTHRDTGGVEAPDACDVHASWRDLVQVVPRIDAMSQLARVHYTRWSGGLATWTRRLA